jgi:hypothetical protein
MAVIAGERAAKDRVGAGISIADHWTIAFRKTANPLVGRGSRPADEAANNASSSQLFILALPIDIPEGIFEHGFGKGGVSILPVWAWVLPS